MIKLFLVIIVFGLSNLSFTQRFKIDVGAGYGFGITPTFINTQYLETNSFNGVFSFNQSSEQYSLNRGITSHLKVNYAFNQELFAVIGARYQNGTQKYEDRIINLGSEELEVLTTRLYKYDQLDVQIGLGIEKQLSDRLSITMSHGFTFFVYGNLDYSIGNEVLKGSLPASMVLYKLAQIDKPAFTFGAYGDIALNYKLTRNLSLFLNTTLQSKNWSSKSSKRTKYEIDGVDLLSTSASTLETEYTSTYSVNSNDQSEPDKPAKALKTWSPNSGVEAILGLRIGFGGDAIIKDTIARSIGPYFQGSIGYGTPMSELTQIVSENSSFETIEPSLTSEIKSKLFSYGKGPAANILLGFRRRKVIAFEVGAVFNWSEYQSTKNYENLNGLNIIYDEDIDELNSAWILRNTYGIKFETDFKKWNAFVRTGLSLGFSQVRERIDYVRTEYFPNDVYRTLVEYEYSGGVSVGGYIGLGASVRLTKDLDFLAEAVTYIQNWSPKRRENTINEINYTDQLDGLSVYDTNVEYVSELTNTTPNMNEAEQQLRKSLPFSSFMMTIGIRYNLGKINLKDTPKSN